MIETKSSFTAARIRALNAVFEEGSYSAAARYLGMTQPAVSQAIQDLEKAFNVQLFERRGRRLLPTEFCMELAPIADEMIRLERSALDLLDRGRRVESGVLRVSFGNLTPGLDMIRAFQQKFPKVQVQTEYAIYSNVMDAVLERRADIGILPNLPKDGRFYSKICLSQQLITLVPLRHAFASAPKLSVFDLAAEKLIFQKKGSATQKVVDQAFNRANLAPRPTLVLEKGSEVYEAVASGMGIGFMWSHGTSRKDGLRRIPIEEISSSYDEFVFRRADLNNPIVDLFFSTITTKGAT